ncbi:Rhombotin-1 [Liparis tanakae]|uniref:Rhombotin-1 n=1 Tax=Liparis tanakae TaxID=230148 RepID=A0A4Z2J8W8_9TELE|nr:Rhombotin-1 [Liparis tanakae]
MTWRLFGTTGNCAACSKLIPAFEMVMRARDNVYHLDCFACQLCNQRFCVGDKFFLKNNMILCQMDYEEGQLNGSFETQLNFTSVKQAACHPIDLPNLQTPTPLLRPRLGPGFYPPVMHQLSLPEDPGRWGVDPSQSMAHSAEAMAKVKGVGRGRKYNLMAQLTCKGKTTESENHTETKANVENKITPDDELVRLQERLLQTEKKMERIVSEKTRCSGRRRKSKASTSKKEEKLLKQLRQITQLIHEGRLEADSPEMEAEEVPYCVEWEEGTYEEEEEDEVEEGEVEQGEVEEDEVEEDEVEEDDEGTEVEEEEEVDEDDPVMEAESLQFSCEGCLNPEEEAEEDDEEYLFLPVEDDGPTHADVHKDVGATNRNTCYKKAENQMSK